MMPSLGVSPVKRIFLPAEGKLVKHIELEKKLAFKPIRFIVL
jgi:hypothetical protein